MFRRLAVFVAGATQEAIEAVSNAKGDLNLDFLDAIEALVDNNLLRRVGGETGEPRFAMFETMREYGLARLAEAGEEKFVRKAHAAYFLVLAEDSQPHLMGPQREMWFERFEAERGNIRAAMDWLLESGEAQWALRFGAALGLFWRWCGLAVEGHEYLLKVLALPGAAPRNAIQAAALAWTRATVLTTGENWELVRARCVESREIFEELGDVPGVFRAMNDLAATASFVGEIELARQQWELAAGVASRMGDRRGQAGALSNLAGIERAQGNVDLAAGLHDESRRLRLEAGDEAGAAWSLSGQADLARDRQDHARARALYGQTLATFSALNDHDGICICHCDLGSLDADEGDYAGAARHFGETLRLYLDQHGLAQVPGSLEGLAHCAVATGRPERALTLAGAAAAVRRLAPFGLPNAAMIEATLAQARRRLPDAQAAASWMRGFQMRPEEAARFALEE